LPNIAKDLFDKLHNFIKKIINRIKGKKDEDYCEIDFKDYILSYNEEADNNYINENQDNHNNDSLNPYSIFILLTVLNLTFGYYLDNSDFQIIIDDFFKSYVHPSIKPDLFAKLVYGLIFTKFMTYCNEFTVNSELEDQIKNNDTKNNNKDVSNQDNNSAKEDNTPNDNLIEDKKKLKMMI
jgi:hypothetical protein